MRASIYRLRPVEIHREFITAAARWMIGGEALVGFVGAHGDAFEFLELAEEILDQVTPLVDFGVDRQRRGAPWMLRDHDLWRRAR